MFLSTHISFLGIWLPSYSPDVELSRFWPVTKSSFTGGTGALVPVQENGTTALMRTRGQHAAAQWPSRAGTALATQVPLTVFLKISHETVRPTGPPLGS